MGIASSIIIECVSLWNLWYYHLKHMCLRAYFYVTAVVQSQTIQGQIKTRPWFFFEFMIIELNFYYKIMCFTGSQKITSVYIALSFRKIIVSVHMWTSFNNTHTHNKIKWKDLKSTLLTAANHSCNFPSFGHHLPHSSQSSPFLSVSLDIYPLKKYALSEEPLTAAFSQPRSFETWGIVTGVLLDSLSMQCDPPEVENSGMISLNPDTSHIPFLTLQSFHLFKFFFFHFYCVPPISIHAFCKGNKIRVWQVIMSLQISWAQSNFLALTFMHSHKANLGKHKWGKFGNKEWCLITANIT